MKYLKNIGSKIFTALPWIIGIAFIISVSLFVNWADKIIAGVSYESTASSTATHIDQHDQEIRFIMEEDSFQQRAWDEAETIYWQRVMKEARNRLEELDGKGFTPDAMKEQALKDFMSEYNDELLSYAAEIVKLPRWQEAVAIAVHETHLCTTGVGLQNNCGGIKRADGSFKKYATAFDGIEDISILLQKPRYRDLTIAEMNGVYCVDEDAGHGSCDYWTENIEANIEKIEQQFAALF